MSDLSRVLVSPLIYTIGGILASSLVFYSWIRPKEIDSCVSGLQRHRSHSERSHNEPSESGMIGLGWRKVPSLLGMLFRWHNFRIWCHPILNLGFGGAFFNVTTPECLKHILVDNFENYEKGKLDKFFQGLFGKNLFSVDGGTWRFHRHVVLASLNRGAVQYGAFVIVEKLEKVERLLDERAESEQIFDFQGLAYGMILDVLIKIGFGFDLNSMVESDHAVPFVEAFNELQALIHERTNDPLWELKLFLAIGDREKRIKYCSGIIDDFADEIINATRSRENQYRPDFVSSFLYYCEEQGKPGPTNEEIRDLVIEMVIGGRDSTAAALSWTIFELIKHPQVAEHIRNEVDRVCRGSQLSYDLVQNLPYTQAVVMESLRLHPPVPNTFCFAKNDDILPDGTKIPAGSMVLYSMNTINRSQKVWTDPDTFKPDRFLQDQSERHGCPCEPLCLIQLKMCLAFLLPRYDFIDTENHSGDFHCTLVMSMKGGFKVNVQKRT